MLRKTINSICGDDVISREAGEKVRMVCESCIKKGELLSLDFQCQVIASTSFFHEAFIKLLNQGITSEEFGSMVTLDNLDPRDQRLFEALCSRAWDTVHKN